MLQKWVTAGLKASSSQQSQLITLCDGTNDSRKGHNKERKTSSTDQNDYGVCLLRDSPYRILRVSYFKQKKRDPFQISIDIVTSK